MCVQACQVHPLWPMLACWHAGPKHLQPHEHEPARAPGKDKDLGHGCSPGERAPLAARERR